MGRKSSGQNKGEGALDKAKGKAKEAAGAVTGDEAKKSEGRSDQTKGTAKDKLGKAKDLLKYPQQARRAKGRDQKPRPSFIAVLVWAFVPLVVYITIGAL